MDQPEPNQDLSPESKQKRIVYLLGCFAEEAGEVAKEAHKILRFGPDNAWNGLTPRQRIGLELMDIVIGQLLEELGFNLLPDDQTMMAHIPDKMARLERAYQDSRLRMGSSNPIRATPTMPTRTRLLWYIAIGLDAAAIVVFAHNLYVIHHLNGSVLTR